MNAQDSKKSARNVKTLTAKAIESYSKSTAAVQTLLVAAGKHCIEFQDFDMPARILNDIASAPNSRAIPIIEVKYWLQQVLGAVVSTDKNTGKFVSKKNKNGNSELGIKFTFDASHMEKLEHYHWAAILPERDNSKSLTIDLDKTFSSFASRLAVQVLSNQVSAADAEKHLKELSKLFAAKLNDKKVQERAKKELIDNTPEVASVNS